MKKAFKGLLPHYKVVRCPALEKIFCKEFTSDYLMRNDFNSPYYLKSLFTSYNRDVDELEPSDLAIEMKNFLIDARPHLYSQNNKVNVGIATKVTKDFWRRRPPKEYYSYILFFEKDETVKLETTKEQVSELKVVNADLLEKTQILESEIAQLNIQIEQAEKRIEGFLDWARKWKEVNKKS